MRAGVALQDGLPAVRANLAPRGLVMQHFMNLGFDFCAGADDDIVVARVK